MQLSGLQDLYRSEYTFINHVLLFAFIERYHTKTSSFHLFISEMSITLNGVSSLLHLPVKGRLLNYSRLIRLDALEMMIQYLRGNSGDSQQEIDDTRWYHAKFGFLERLYKYHLDATLVTDGDDTLVAHHRACTLR